MSRPASYEVLLFEAVRQLDDPTERSDFLAWTLRNEPEMLARLQAMLEAEDEFSEWFEGASAVRARVAADIVGDGSPFLEESLKDSGDGLEMPAGIAGRFEVLRRIGAGGGGEVFVADQLEPIRRKVAIKVLRAGLETPDFLAAFRRETQSLAMMSHPNIAVIHDAGTTESGRPYFIMEMLEGRKITDFCDDARHTIPRRLELFLQVCEAIQHAHQKGVIHRDIKPGNLLVITANGQPRVKVIDFGIASVVDEGAADLSSLAAGTPAFMSPEQAAGATDIDTRTDIFALGLVLRELLAGPRGGAEKAQSLSRAAAALEESELSVLAAARSTSPPRLLASLRGDLDAIVAKATSPDRQARYATTAGLAMDIQRHLQHEPVMARPPHRGYRLAKLVRRNRLAFASGALAFALLVAGFGTSTWLFLREAEARREQSRLRDEAELARAAETRLRERAEAGELCAQAAVRLSYDHTEEADALVAGIRQGMIPSSLEAKDVFAKLGEWHRGAGRWPEAAHRYASLAESHLSVDASDSADVSLGTLYALGAVCRAGDWPRYEHLRKITLDRFAKSREPHVAEQVIKLVLLRPADDAALRRLAPLAEVLRFSIPKAPPSETIERNLQAWSCVSLALWCYRSGDFDGAITAARHTRIMDVPWNPARNAIADMLDALATWKLGHTNEARAILARVSESIPVIREGFSNSRSGEFYSMWWDGEITSAFYEEAVRVIK